MRYASTSRLTRLLPFLAGLLVSTLAATAPAGTPLKFSVNVTTSNAPGFVPFSFDEIITVDSPTNAVVTLYPMAGNLLKSDTGVAASFPGTPVTASLLAMLAPITPSGSLFAETGYYLDYSYGNGQVRFQSQSVQLFQSGAVWNYETYNHEIIKVFPLASVADVQPMTLARMISLITAHGPLTWNEFASKQVMTAPHTGDVISYESLSYQGTATLVEVLPEPASVAVLLIAAPALARRRRTV